MRPSGDIDYIFLGAAMALAVLGAAMSLSLSPASSLVVQSSDRLFFFKREMARMLVAGLALFFFLKINYRRYRWAIGPAFLASLAMLAAALALGGHRGARSWVWGMQPAELGRLTLVLFLTHYLDRSRDRMASLFRGFLLPLTAVGLVCALILLQPDFGSALAVAAIGYGMLFLAGTRILWWGAGIAASAVALILLALARPHILGRLQGYWVVLTRPDMLEEIAAQASGHLKHTLIHSHQSLLAIGSGGLWGVGLGQSKQKYLFLSEAHTDFVFSIIAEEGGFLIALSVLIIFLILIWRGMRLAAVLNDRFERLAVGGLVLSLMVYATINLMVNLGLFPIAGLPLPFVSYGGTALAVNAASVGLILNISQHREERTLENFSRKRYESNNSRWRDGRSPLSRSGRGRRSV